MEDQNGNTEVRTAEVSVAELARLRNMKKRLYCTECCTYFQMVSNGDWVETRNRSKIAEVVADSFINCTCGTRLAVIIKEPVVVGEVVPLI